MKKTSQIALILLPAFGAMWASGTARDPLVILLGCFAFGGLLSAMWFSLEVGHLLLKRKWTSGLTFRFAFAGALLLMWSIAVWHWPLQVAFTIWRAPLAQLMERVDRGVPVHTPQWVGPFLIVGAEKRYGSYPALILDNNPNGPTSFVRKEPSELSSWSYIQLPDGWALFDED